MYLTSFCQFKFYKLKKMIILRKLINIKKPDVDICIDSPKSQNDLSYHIVFYVTMQMNSAELVQVLDL